MPEAPKDAVTRTIAGSVPGTGVGSGADVPDDTVKWIFALALKLKAATKTQQQNRTNFIVWYNSLNLFII